MGQPGTQEGEVEVATRITQEIYVGGVVRPGAVEMEKELEGYY